MPTSDQLAAQRTIDITTTGRQSGRPVRIEIWWFRIDGRFIITGTPGPRDWFANVLADSRMTIHAAGHDLPATATSITDPEFRRAIVTDPQTSWYTDQVELEAMVDSAPMIEIMLDLPG